MIDLHFRAPDAATFMADLDAFTDANGWPSLLIDVVDADNEPTGVKLIPDCRITGSTRIDTIQGLIYTQVGETVDGEGIVSPVMEGRGWHIDVRMSEANPRHPTGAYVAVAAAVSAWFAPFGESDYVIPAAVETAYSPSTVQVEVGETVDAEGNPVPVMGDRGTILVRTTARGCQMLPPPTHPKRTWA